MFFSNILGERFWVFVAAYGLSLVLENRSYWSGYPFPSPRDLPNPGIKPRSSELQADSLSLEPPGKPQSTCWQPFHGYPLSRPLSSEPHVGHLTAHLTALHVSEASPTYEYKTELFVFSQTSPSPGCSILVNSTSTCPVSQSRCPGVRLDSYPP